MKVIDFGERKETGRILRNMRKELHESPESLARIAGLTRVQLGELEKGTWGEWNPMPWEDAKERYFQALAAVEKRNTTPPASRKSSGRGGRMAMQMLAMGLAFAPQRDLPQRRAKYLGPKKERD